MAKYIILGVAAVWCLGVAIGSLLLPQPNAPQVVSVQAMGHGPQMKSCSPGRCS